MVDGTAFGAEFIEEMSTALTGGRSWEIVDRSGDVWFIWDDGYWWRASF